MASKLAQAQWTDDGTVNEKLTTIRAALVGAAQATLGERKRNDPDWFREISSL